MRTLYEKRRGKVSSHADSALFYAKNFRFFAIYVVFARTRGERVKPVRTSGEKSVLVRTSFMDEY